MTARVQKRLRLVTVGPVVNHSVSYKSFQLLTSHLVCFLPLCLQPRVKNARFSREKMQLQCLDQQEGQANQGDHTRDKIRHRVRQMLSDLPAVEDKVLIKGEGEICEP